MTDKATICKHAFITFGPETVYNNPSLFRITFMPRTLMQARALNEPPRQVHRWEAVLVVDATGEGKIVYHEELSPQVAELDREDFEAKALELVRAMKA